MMDVDDLDNHPKNNTSKKKHLCPICGSGFTKPSGLVRHERIHTGEKPYKCELCPASFSQSSSLKIHLRKHTGEKPFKCQHCGQAFAHSHRLKSHILKFHTHTHHKCNICGLEFACNIDLHKHVASHAVCEKLVSDDQKDETAQINLLTLSGNTTDCPQIPQTVGGQGHSGVNNSECTPQQRQKECCEPVCESRENDFKLSCECHIKMFSSIKISKSLLKSNPINQTYMCDVCGLFFTNPSSLNDHLKIHKKDKPFKCNSYDQSFTHVSDLKNHIIMRTHTGKKPFSCKLCGVRFKHSQALKAHANVHQGNGIHTCNFCGIAYSSFKSFNRHLQTHSEYYKSKGETTGSLIYPTFVVQEASVNQGLHLTTAGNEQPIEPVSLEGLGDSQGKLISGDIPEIEGEEVLRDGRNASRNGLDLESPSLTSLEAFPTFQDYYLSETENTALDNDHENMQDNLHTPESLVNEFIKIRSPLTLVVESGNGMLDLKDRIQTNENSMNEISHNYSYDVSASEKKSSYEIYSNLEKNYKNRFQEETNENSTFHIALENNVMRRCDEGDQSEMALLSALGGETEFLNNHVVKSASLLNQIDLDNSIYSPHLKESMEIYEQNPNISPFTSTSNSISCFKSSLSYNLPIQVKTTLNNSIADFMRLYIPSSNVTSSGLMLMNEENNYPAMDDAADVSSNKLGIMNKRATNNIYSDERKSSESFETFQSFTSTLELKQPDGKGDTCLNKPNLRVEMQSETEKRYFLSESDRSSGSIETSVMNQKPVNLQCKIQRPNTASIREGTLNYLSNIHDESQILKFDKDKLSTEETSPVVSADIEKNVMYPSHSSTDKNILSGSSDLFQTGREELLLGKRVPTDSKLAINDTSVVFSCDKNISEDSNNITYNTKIMENNRSITEKSVYKNSSSQKIDFQLALKSQEISAALTSSDIALKTRTGHNSTRLDPETKNTNQNDKDSTLFGYLKAQEKKPDHQFARGVESQDFRETEEKVEKQLKCVNCPLGLFDASVISVLCEDQCFGDMLERHHPYEENNDIGENVDSNAATTQKTSMLFGDQVENVNMEFNKKDNREQNINHLYKMDDEISSAFGQYEKSALRLEENDYENETQNLKNDAINFPEITLQTDEEHGDKKINKDENGMHLEQLDVEILESNVENMSKKSLHLRNADVNTFSQKQQIIKDSIFIAQPVKEYMHSINAQESSFQALSFEKSPSDNVEQDCDTSNMENLKPDTLRSEVSLMQTSLAYSRSHPSRSQQKSTVVKYKYNQNKYRSDFAQKENLNEQLQIHVCQCHENGSCCHDQFNESLSHLTQHHCHEETYSREPSHVCPIYHLFFLFHKTLDNCLKMPIGNTNINIKLLEMTATNSPSRGAHLGTHLSYFSFLSSTNSYADPQQKIDEHEDKHTTYLCQVCGESLSSLSMLNHHVRRHNKKNSFTCKICFAVFYKRSNLVKHRSVHSHERPYKCNICSKSFTQKTNLHIHMRTHTGERPFSCKICKANFAHSQALKLHLRFHAKDTRYVCQDCGKGFVIKAALQKHLQSHTGEKPFICHICDTRLSSQSSLSRHMKRHLGNDFLPFSCTLCSQRFAKSSHLKLHMKSHTTCRIKKSE